MARETEGYISPIKFVPLDPNWKSKVNFHLVESEDEIKKVLSNYNYSENAIAVDTETTGLNYDVLDIVGYSFCFNLADAYYIPLQHKVGSNLDMRVLQDFFKLLEKSYRILFYNYLFDFRVLRKYGLGKIKYFDVMPLVWNVDTNIHMPALKWAVKAHCGIESGSYTDVLGKAENFAFLSPQQVYEYAAADPYFTLILMYKLLPFYNSNKFIVDLDNRLLEAMLTYEDTPVRIDMELVKRFSTELATHLGKLEGDIYQIVGQTFKIGSPEVLSQVLQTLGVTTGKFTARKGYMATGIDELEAVKNQHRVIPYIIQYKKLLKKLSTYVEPFVKGYNPKIEGLRFQYQTSNVPTSRLSSGTKRESKDGNSYFAAINVQSIPKPGSANFSCKEIVSENSVLGYEFLPDAKGKYESNGDEENVRRFFIPQEGHYVLAIDYVMEELVVAANLSKDPAFLEPIKAGKDLHGETAKLMFSDQKYDKTLRKIAKICNFAQLYGGNENTLHVQMPDKTLEECKVYSDRWAQIHHFLLNGYLPKICAEARSRGFSTNAFGRIRRVAYWYNTGSPRDRSFADRTVWNNQVQGTCGDLMRVALIKIFEKVISNPKYKGKIYFMASLHDELVFSVTKEMDIFTEIANKIVELLTKVPFKWEIPLQVSLSVGHNWGSTFEFKFIDGKWQPVSKGD